MRGKNKSTEIKYIKNYMAKILVPPTFVKICSWTKHSTLT